MSVKIKLCGLKRKEDVLSVNRYKPDFAGFVFAGTKRRITFEEAKTLKKLLSDDIAAVGVFVNEPMEHIIRLVFDKTIDIVQLHGDERRDYIEELKNKAGCPVIKAVRVKNAEQVIEAFKLPADYLLFDSYMEGQYGGSGSTFNHSVIKEAVESLGTYGKKNSPYFIAGGLTAETIAAAIQICCPYAVDVSSGAEINGWKDDNKIREVIEAARLAKETG